MEKYKLNFEKQNMKQMQIPKVDVQDISTSPA